MSDIIGYVMTPVLACGCHNSCAEPAHIEFWKRRHQVEASQS